MGEGQGLLLAGLGTLGSLGRRTEETEVTLRLSNRQAPAPVPAAGAPAYLRGLVGNHDALSARDGVVHVLGEAVALHADEVAGRSRLSCQEGTGLQRGAQLGSGHACGRRIAASWGPQGRPHWPPGTHCQLSGPGRAWSSSPPSCGHPHSRAQVPLGRKGAVERKRGAHTARHGCLPARGARPALPRSGCPARPSLWAQGLEVSPSLKSRPSSWLGQRFTTSVTCSAFL